jgi:hypothetical protein
MRHRFLPSCFILLATFVAASAVLAQSEDAKSYISVRRQYEQYRCEQVKLMRAQGNAGNANDGERMRELMEQRVRLASSADAVRLESQLSDLREKLMMAHNQEDYDAILVVEGELRSSCR